MHSMHNEDNEKAEPGSTKGVPPIRHRILVTGATGQLGAYVVRELVARGADFVVWQTHFPAAHGMTTATGDADNDGDVDGADFVVWQTNFASASSTGTATVPEPPGIACGWALLLAAFRQIGDRSKRRSACENSRRGQ